MKVFVILALVAAAVAVPVEENPDRFMYNEGMLGGDIKGGYQLVKNAEGKTTVIPDSWYIYWPNSVIYYEIDSSLNNERGAIQEAMEEYHRNTCLRFEERNGNTNIRNYIYIRGDLSGCWSYMGMYTQGYQEVSLQRNGCVYKGTIMHELMHAAGFWHEHQRFDRDDYVRIRFENVISGYESNFDIADLSQSVNVGGASYDFDSVMHYELTAFSSNGQRTIEPYGGQDPGFVWDQNYFSAGDINQLNAVYC
ncbi:unnamed protein product [Notodromas monacha]|uniref:Metalloendopeptidase n=1 Tax=Notodromas monacha TaxID=399045 RepID=A0A7R9BHS1_9CRUS|nr:unnamed protein product [Notodromas monacha]CAG0915469.1 unnamed protein product [Notodromas monacha]